MSLLGITRKNKDTKQPPIELDVLPEIAPDQVVISEPAVKRIRSLLSSEDKPTGYLRIGIVGGGCSGLSYHYAVEETCRPNDHIFETQGVRICADPKSLKIIGGSRLEWHEKEGRSGFRLRNKRETKSCSCGESFAL